MIDQITSYVLGANEPTTLYCLSDASAVIPFPASAIMASVKAGDWPAIQGAYPESFTNQNQLRAQVTCYLIQQGDRIILVDTGNGETFTPLAGHVARGQLLDKLDAIGITPERIDTVFHTHLHPDHVGWNMRRAGEEWVPTFPNAHHFAPQQDWQMCETLLASGAPEAMYVEQQLLPLQTEQRLTLVDGEYALTPSICALPTPGHSPGHMSIQVTVPGSAPYLIAGDAFFHPLQLARPHCHTAIDARNDAAQANATRAKLVATIMAEEMLVSACHFYRAAFGRVTTVDGANHWEPI
ncbi:MAG: MBL fold metallo-hydrolase [Caldilineaceae bacterium]|nr:MBL fold metallo-hydrolase [Caldilineaceae bacterium]